MTSNRSTGPARARAAIALRSARAAAFAVATAVAAAGAIQCGGAPARTGAGERPAAAGAREAGRASRSAPAQEPPPESARASPASSGAPRVVAPVPRPTKRLTVPEARRYMLALLNRDRATEGLPPLELDEGAATAAGQAHAEDMARLGYLGHWGSDGSVPEQRHTEAGGADTVFENALCFTDEKRRELDPKPLIDPAYVEKSERQFFDEVPPNDGHRRNILRPSHTKVGIGVAQPVATATEIPVPCFAQELTDAYGTYAPLPKRARVGAKVRVEGALSGGAKPTGVGIARLVPPKPIAVSELDTRRSYPIPKPYQMFWGPGFVTPVPVKIDGPRFSIEVPLSDHRRPGLYEISVWAKLPGSEENAMVSLRTIRVE